MKLGLIGKNLSHSFSKKYFETKFEQHKLTHTYENLEFVSETELLASWSELARNFDGLNITIPYKKTLMECVNEIDPHAERIGAINCVAIQNGKSIGYNTDFQGFYKSVYKKSFSRNKQALIIGNGGAAAAVRYAIEVLLKMPVETISRDGIDLQWSELAHLDLSPYALIVNTTPVGMYPNIDEYLNLHYTSAHQDSLFVDLIYHPMITRFLENADQQGCMILNGLPMLHAQAELAWEIWSR